MIAIVDYSRLNRLESQLALRVLCTVDDHFAKALGETWTRLKATNWSKKST